MAKKKKPAPLLAVDPFREIFIRLAEFVFDKESKKIDIGRVEQVLYTNAGVDAFMTYGRPVSQGQLTQEINQFINRMLDAQQAKVVVWLLKQPPEQTRILDNKTRRAFDDSMLHYVKKALWLCAYYSLYRLNLPLLPPEIEEALCRLEGVFSTDETVLNGWEEKEKYLVNILSLKDARHGFLPYPEHISPFDLAMLLEDNALHKQYPDVYHFTLSLQSAIYNAYERYHIFKFVRDIIYRLLQEKYRQ